MEPDAEAFADSTGTEPNVDRDNQTQEEKAFVGKVVNRRKNGDLLFVTLQVVPEVNALESGDTSSEPLEDVGSPGRETTTNDTSQSTTTATKPEVSQHVQALVDRKAQGGQLAAIFLLGSLFQVSGTVDAYGNDKDKRTSIHVQEWTLLRASADAGLRGVERVIEACNSGLLSREEAAKSLLSTVEEVSALAQKSKENPANKGTDQAQIASPSGAAGQNVRELSDPSTSPSPAERKRLLVAISRRLKGLPVLRHRLRPPKTKPKDLDLLSELEEALPALECEDVLVEMNYSPNATLGGDSRSVRRAKRKQGEYESLDQSEREHKLKAIKQSAGLGLPFDPLDSLPHDGITDTGYVDYCISRKAPQVLWMAARLREVFKMDSGGQVIDIGCGRGDLALNIAALFPATQVVAIDTNEASLQVGRDRAATHGLGNVRFLGTSVQELSESSLEASTNRVLVGLHACGGLSDAVLALAARLNAGVLCATCCFTKLSELREPELAWWGTPQGKRLASLSELHEAPAVSRRAMRLVNSLRLRHAASKRPLWNVRLLSFPAALSPKNQVLCISQNT